MRNIFKTVYCEDCEYCDNREYVHHAKCMKSPRSRTLTFISRERDELIKTIPLKYRYCDGERWFRFCFKYKEHK